VVARAGGPQSINLPADVTSFVGRRHELAEVKRLLASTRLLTLTGAGGSGKSRLAVRSAAELSRGFPDGVRLVELAALGDPALVVHAVFRSLHLRDQTSSWPLDTLSRYLADRRMLLVLDNCEHLLDACAVLVDTLLEACPDLRFLTTSRQPLGIAGETTFRVPSLGLPDADLRPSATAW
jgi:predicted ATPase